MATKIKILSEHTINQIAAGEVIENPASLVKELIENSLDAGSSKIIVEVLGGGLQRIKIVDNGSGMGPEDALLSLERHATSKIKEASDLLDVGTMGFRGEALASIAAISKLTLQTADALGVGTEVQVEAGKILEVRPCARTQGTTIEIKQLFFNVPARKKFQKSPGLCLADITKAVIALSLAHPFICFELYNGDDTVLKLMKPSTENLLEALKIRAKEVLGDEFLEDFTPLEGSFSSFSFVGLLGAFHNTRPNRSLQHQFINQRSVSCPAVSFAVKDAFGTRIEEKRFPIYVLHLTIPKDFIDVNVHPQKKEIRLQDERWFKEKLREKIEEKLTSTSSPLSSEPVSFNLFSERNFFSRPEAPIEPFQMEFKAPFEEEQFQFSFEMEPEVVGLYEHFLWVNAASVAIEGMPNEGLFLIDLKRAGSQVLFTSLKKEEAGKEKQMLFLPLTLTCSIDEMQKIESSLEEIEKLGFSLQKNRNSFLIDAIPSTLGEQEALDFLKDYLCLEEKESFLEQKREKQLASACAKLSSQRKIHYTEQNALALLKILLKTPSPCICPLGGKIITFLGKDDLQQLFLKK